MNGFNVTRHAVGNKCWKCYNYRMDRKVAQATRQCLMVSSPNEKVWRPAHASIISCTPYTPFFIS